MGSGHKKSVSFPRGSDDRPSKRRTEECAAAHPGRSATVVPSRSAPPRHGVGCRRRPHRETAHCARQGRRLCRHEEVWRGSEPAGISDEEARRHIFTLPWRGRVDRRRRSGRGEVSRQRRSLDLARPQTPPRRNARSGIPALPPRRRQTAQARTPRRHKNLPAHRLPPVRPRVRPRTKIERRRTGTSGWMEEKVGALPAPWGTKTWGSNCKPLISIGSLTQPTRSLGSPCSARRPT